MTGPIINSHRHTGYPKKKSIDKKLLFRAAQGFNSQFLNLFGFSISVSFFGASFKGFGSI